MSESDNDKSTYNIFWTGGFDSTVALLLALSDGHIVRPIYLKGIDKRESSDVEESIMQEITADIRQNYPELGKRLLDVDVVSNVIYGEDIERVCADITYGTSPRKQKMGFQMRAIAHFLNDFQEEFVAIGVERGEYGRSYKLVKKYINNEFIDESLFDSNLSKNLYIFKKLRFPIIELTKEELLAKSKELGFEDIVGKTWTCWYPQGGKPCNKCMMCSERIL